MPVPPHRTVSPHKKAKVCGAQRIRQPGVYCQSVAVYPNGRCRVHGGIVSAGPANPSWKDGRVSKYMPKRLQADYHASINDPARLELGNQIATLDARFAELLRGLGTDPSDAGYGKLLEKWSKLQRAARLGQDDVFNELWEEIGNGLRGAVRVEATWHELYIVTERRRRLVESERKRLLESAEMLTLAQTMMLVERLQEAVIKHVTDRSTLGSIANEFAKLIGPITSSSVNVDEASDSS